MEKLVKSVHISRFDGVSITGENDKVIRENQVAVYVDGEQVISAPCLKHRCELFVYAALFLEMELLPEHVSMVEWKDTTAFVHLREGVAIRRRKHGREEPLTEELRPSFTAQEINQAVEAFQKLSDLFRKTGAVHVAARADRTGLLEWFEDISRRSALDKVIGAILLKNMGVEKYPPVQEDNFLITSGRISSDIARRAVEVGMPMLVSLAPPSDRAVELARRYNLTLVGFARPPRFNIYTHSERIRL
jgi:FdhD protein